MSNTIESLRKKIKRELETSYPDLKARVSIVQTRKNKDATHYAVTISKSPFRYKKKNFSLDVLRQEQTFLTEIRSRYQTDNIILDSIIFKHQTKQ